MENRSLRERSWLVFCVAVARLRFVFIFLIAAVVVGYWDEIKTRVDHWTRPAVAPDALAAVGHDHVEYYCVMHPAVVRDQPGDCPICGMPLVKRLAGQEQRLPADVLARVQLTPQRVALADVRTTPVEMRELAYEVRAVGLLDYDETRMSRLSARVAGRAEKLFASSVGQGVKRGDPLYELYSPEVYVTLREMLRANGGKTPSTGPTAGTVDNSRQRLLLWGLTDQQLTEAAVAFARDGQLASNVTITSPIDGVVVTKDLYEGSYLQVGDAAYTVADLSRVWLKVKLYERDVPLVNVGDVATVTVDAAPNRSFSGKVTFKAFVVDPQTRTLDARVEVENHDLSLRPGMFASATIHVPVSRAVDLPATTRPTPSASREALADAFAGSLDPYFKLHKQMVASDANGAARLFDEITARLQPVSADPQLSADVRRATDAAGAAKADESIVSLRNELKAVSAAMLAIGRQTGLPPGAPAVQAFFCPMRKAGWLQPPGTAANPYMAETMPTCGDDVGPLPVFGATPATTTASRPAPTASGRATGWALAVPRSAVIDTGRDKIVYVASAAGVYDMRAVTLGPVAGEFYPVIRGLDEGDQVVTNGAFLVDAENRLNPAKVARP